MESHPYEMDDSDCEPRSIRESQIVANIKVLITRFGVNEDEIVMN